MGSRVGQGLSNVHGRSDCACNGNGRGPRAVRWRTVRLYDSDPTTALIAGAGFADLLKRYRTERGLTQETLAERAGLSTRGVRALEQGKHGRPYRSTVSLLADALNLPETDKAEFTSAARGEVLTRQAPIGAYLGARAVGPLIGRESEVERILAQEQAASNGAGKLLLLSGEPGVGKTRLAQEAMAHLSNRGYLVATGRCYEPQQPVPFYPFFDALSAAYAACPTSIRSEVGRRWPYLGYLLPGQPALQPVSSTGTEGDHHRLCRAVAGFILAMAHLEPVALLLDDLQWMDTASLDLLQYLTREAHGHRILLLGTYRRTDLREGHPLLRALVDLTREGLADVIAVELLGVKDTRALAAATLGEPGVSEGLAAQLHRRTEGNPFFAHQVLRSLLEQGHAVETETSFTSTVVQELAVPETVRAVIEHRLGRLPDRTQAILAEASVLGQTFTFECLRAMSRSSEDDVEGALEQAIEHGMVRESTEQELTFDHALTQETVYSRIPAPRRHRLHRAAGDALETLPDRKRRDRAGELAWHFLQSDELERALPWILTAGDEAEGLFAHSDAEIQFKTALRVAHEVGDTALALAAQEKLGRTLRLAGRYEEALAALESAADGYRRCDDLDGEIRATGQVLRVHVPVGTYQAGLAAAGAIGGRLQVAVASPGVVEFYVALAELQRQLANQPEELSASEAAVEFARSLGEDHAVAHALSCLGLALADLGRGAKATEALQAALPILEAHTNLIGLARCYAVLAFVTWNQGDPASALRYQQHAVDLAEGLGDPNYVSDFSLRSRPYLHICRRLGRGATNARTISRGGEQRGCAGSISAARAGPWVAQPAPGFLRGVGGPH